MRRVRYYLGGALFWGAFLAVCVLLFWNAQRLARAAGGISLRYGEALEPRVVASALEYARDGRNNAAWSPTFWAVRQGAASANGREETVRMLRVCGDAELLATEPLLYGARPGRPGRMRGIQRAGLAALGSAGCDGPGAGAGRRTLYGARRV